MSVGRNCIIHAKIFLTLFLRNGFLRIVVNVNMLVLANVSAVHVKRGVVSFGVYGHADVP